MSLAGCNQHLPAFADPIFDTRTQFLTDDNLDYHTGIELSLAYGVTYCPPGVEPALAYALVQLHP